MFNIDLTGITTTRPCPQDGDYVATYQKGEFVDSDKGPRFDVTFVLENDVLGVPVNGGEPPVIPAGYQIVNRYRLYEVSTPRAPKAGEEIARLIDGLLGTNDATRPTDLQSAIASFDGKKCVLNVKAENDDKFGWQPRVKKIKPLN